MAIIEAHNLCKTYRLKRTRVRVLRGASLEAEAGECVAILGKSGSGKSTLLHLLAGLDRPDRAPSAGGDRKDGRAEDGGASRIVFDGVPVDRMSAGRLDTYRNRSIGLVFQFYHLLPELNVVENAMLPAMMGSGALGRLTWLGKRAGVRARASELLDRFGLGERLRHRPGELSGGERQRVAVVRALINEPRVLLADEPTGNLDGATGATILDTLMELRRERGMTMLIVTHDDRVADRADRTLRLEAGIVVGT